MPETEIQQINKEYISDRIKESIDLFGSKPEWFGTILMSAVAVLAMLISKVLQKARELSAKFFEKEVVQTISEPSGGRTTPIIPQTDSVLQQEHKFKEPTVDLSVQQRELQPKTQTTEQKIPQIPPKPVMSAEAAAYPKLSKIYKELNRQNDIIFNAEKERNALELERDSLKGLARLTKKGEIQSKIDRKNEEIDLLKVGLSGIAKRYGFQTVHDFYKVYATAKIAYAEYRDKADRQAEQTSKNKDRGAR